jgi:uncharacterized membrane protein YcgQ (UPF0703/DUF1980 family)
MATPVFICTGFLDSGKSTLIQDTLMEQEWIEDGLTLLLSCEEGEVEYSKEYLESKNMVLLPIEDLEQLNTAFFKNCEKNYHPVQVIIEYNGMWNFGELLSIKFPRGWEIAGIYSTVNGLTLDSYLMNMRNMLMEPLSESSLIIVNRCPEDMNRSGFRRALKIQNPMAQLIFEDLSGNIIEPTEDDLPFDVKGDKVVIEDMDFGVWYVDAYDHPEHYLHKEIEFLAQVFKPNGLGPDYFVPVRKIMTCCAADTKYYGYPCKVEQKIKLRRHQWARVKVRFEYEYLSSAGRKSPVLYLVDLQPAQKPEEEVVYMG